MKSAAAPPLLLALLSAGGALADEHVVLPPVAKSTSLPEKTLVFIPGGKVPNERYAATAASIQAALSEEIRLWVIIPAVFRRLCIISCSTTSLCSPLHDDIEAAFVNAAGKGWVRGKDEQDIWLAGHSLGGVCANTLFQAYTSGSSNPYAGVIVMGSYVDEEGQYSVTNFPKPVFTLNAELDGGLARPGKTSHWWHQYLALVESKGEEAALAEKPVIVLPGLNHSDFCPGFDVPGDLPAEVDQASATDLIGKMVGAFLKVQMCTGAAKAEGMKLLGEKVAWTKEFLAPYLKAQEMERTASDVTTSPEGASPLCVKAQHIIAGLSDADDAKMKVLDGFHVSSPNLEHCHPNWTFVEEGNLLVRSCSHTDFYTDIANTGSITAASEVACKMLSSDRLTQQLKTKAADPKVPCREVNKYVVKVAEALAAPSTAERFKRLGRGWCFEEDAPTFQSIGPLWVFHDSLSLKENSTCMAVSSPVLKTEVDGKIYPGNHYCKFLSPARVLDWMMTDGIKKPGSQATVEVLV